MIFATSDLHFGMSRQGDRAIRRMAATLGTAKDDDVLIIAGDIAIDDQGVSDCLDTFRDFSGKKLAIAGNHDVWVQDGDDSWDRFQRLTDIFHASGFHSLDAAPCIVNGIGFAGTMGWYDGSFRDGLCVPEEWFATKTFSKRTKRFQWNDASMVRWPYTDEAMTQLLAAKLASDLRTLQAVNHVVVVMHHLPSSRLLFHPRWFMSHRRRFFDAFMGSNLFGRVLDRPNVRAVFCGHSHEARTARLGDIQAMTIGSTYRDKILLAYDGRKTSAQRISAS